MNRAANTNVVVRLITQDDPGQLDRIMPLLLDDGKLVVVRTVLLETEWVLRSAFRYSRERILEAFEAVLDIENIRLADESLSRRALELHSQGLDFADAFHLAGSTGCDEFVTFDRDLVRIAANSAVTVVKARLL